MKYVETNKSKKRDMHSDYMQHIQIVVIKLFNNTKQRYE